MPRYRVTLEYDGGPFAGWQRQDGGPSIQAALEDAIFKLLGRARDRDRRRPHRCGRARARPGGAFRHRQGIHRRQIARCAERASAPRSHRGRGGRAWPRPISTRASRRRRGITNTAFSTAARRPRSTAGTSGTWRGRSTPRRCTRRRKRWWACHDFTTFRSVQCQAKSPEKTLDRLDVLRQGEEIAIYARGALVPAQPGALDGGLAETRRRRQMARARHGARACGARPRRAAGRWRRPKA